jgi:small subunit ribosomal protein S5
MALNKAKNEKIPAEKIFPTYTAAEKEEIKKRYTPAQIAAIEAGERAIDPNDIKKRGMIRTDMYAIPFFDDFSKHRPLLDRLPPYEGPVDPNPRLMDLDEASAEMDRAFEEIKKQHTPPTLGKDQEIDDVEYQAKQFPSRLELMKIENEASLLMGSDGKAIPAWKNTKMTAPRLPASFLEDEDGRTEAEKATEKAKGKEEDEVDPRDPDGLYNSLMKQTGMTLDEIFDLKVKILVKHRVVNQTRLGKIASIYCLAIAGDGKGRLGVGEAKGQETEDTMANARITAIRAMHPIPRYENRTIYGDVEGKMSAVEVKLMARPPGKTDPFFTHEKCSDIRRIWTSMPTSHIRNGTSSRYSRSRRTRTSIAKQDEHCQGNLFSLDEAANTRGDCDSEREEAC